MEPGGSGHEQPFDQGITEADEAVALSGIRFVDEDLRLREQFPHKRKVVGGRDKCVAS